MNAFAAQPFGFSLFSVELRAGVLLWFWAAVPHANPQRWIRSQPMHEAGPVDDKYLHNHSYGQVWSSLFCSQAWKVERKSHSLIAAAWRCVYQLPGFQISSSGRKWQLFLFISQSCSSKSNFYIRNGVISHLRTLFGSCRDQLWSYCGSLSAPDSAQDSVSRADLHSVGGFSAFPAKVCTQTFSPHSCSCSGVREKRAWSGRDNEFLGCRIAAHHRPLWVWEHLGLPGQVWTPMGASRTPH